MTRDAPHLERLHRQALRGEHVAHLRGADAERDRAERAVRGGVAVAAGDRHARLREAQLRPDDVDDALRARCPRSKSGMPCSRQFRSSAASMSSAIVSRNGRRLIRASGRCGRRWRTCVPETRTVQPACPQHVERLRAGDLVDQVKADEQLRLPVRQLAAPCARPRPSGGAWRAWGMTADARARRSGLGGRRLGVGHGSGLETEARRHGPIVEGQRPAIRNVTAKWPVGIQPGGRSQFVRWSEVLARSAIPVRMSDIHGKISAAIGKACEAMSERGYLDARTGVLCLDRRDAEGRAVTSTERFDLSRSDPRAADFDSGQYR